MKSKSLYLWILIGTWAATILLYFWFIKSPYFEFFNAWTRQNLLLFYATLLTVKVLAIVWPPLPGGLFTLGSIPFIGWINAYLIDVLGSLIGASIAYVLGRKYGYPFLEKIFDKELVDKVRNTKIRPDRELESMFLGRIMGGGNIMELVSYGAGVLRVRYHNFIIASFLANLIFIPIYYLGGNLFSTNSMLIGVAFSAVTLFIFWKLKGRYVE